MLTLIYFIHHSCNYSLSQSFTSTPVLFYSNMSKHHSSSTDTFPLCSVVSIPSIPLTLFLCPVSGAAGGQRHPADLQSKLGRGEPHSATLPQQWQTPAVWEVRGAIQFGNCLPGKAVPVGWVCTRVQEALDCRVGRWQTQGFNLRQEVDGILTVRCDNIFGGEPSLDESIWKLLL